MFKTKIFAAYLPQYHEIEENNKFWGKGFTDWVGVKKAQPLFEGHQQPRVPLGGKYYDLSDYKVLEEQAKLAKQYNIDGFCIYHYWFKGNKPLLDTPIKNLLEHKEIDISYFLSWDNSSWVRSWSNIPGNAWAPSFDGKEGGREVMLEYQLGDREEWRSHFNYLLPYFRDERYYKISGKPVFCIFHIGDEKKMQEMWKFWNELAKENGLPGVYLISKVGTYRNYHYFDSEFQYQPVFFSGFWDALKQKLYNKFNRSSKLIHRMTEDYELFWKKIIKRARKQTRQHIFTSGVVRFDDTPRRGENARMLIGESPELFKKYFKKLYLLNCKAKMEFLLVTAWNEWGEGAYLEPDERDQYEYLQAIKEVVDEGEERL